MFLTTAMMIASVLPPQHGTGPRVVVLPAALSLSGPELHYTATRLRAGLCPAMTLHCEGDQVVILLSGLSRQNPAPVNFAIGGRSLSAVPQTADGTARLSMLAGPRTLDALDRQSSVTLKLAGRSHILRHTNPELRQRFIQSCRMGFSGALGPHDNLPPTPLVTPQPTLSIRQDTVDSPPAPR